MNFLSKNLFEFPACNEYVIFKLFTLKLTKIDFNHRLNAEFIGMLKLGRVSRCRRYFSDMPDISHPKWSRREKLSEMNFANKGKGGFRVMKSL